MDRNFDFLNAIFQNAQMGIDSSEQLIKTLGKKNAQEIDDLNSLVDEYQTIRDEAKQRLNKRGVAEKDIPSAEKLMSKFGIAMNTLIDKSPAHVAEMMMQGITMGIADITKQLKQYEDAQSKNLVLGQSLLVLHERAMERWKQLLYVNTK